MLSYSWAQDVVDAVYAILCNDPRVSQFVREQESLITQDDIECRRIDFDLTGSGPMCGVRVRLDIPVVEFQCSSEHRWTYDEFLAPGNKFTERLHDYLDRTRALDSYESMFSREIEAARLNPEIVKNKKVWRAYLKRCQDLRSRGILKRALQRICEDPVHDAERRPFHRDFLALL